MTMPKHQISIVYRISKTKKGGFFNIYWNYNIKCSVSKVFPRACYVTLKKHFYARFLRQEIPTEMLLRLIHPPPLYRDSGPESDTIREVAYLKELKYDNIVKLLDVFLDKEGADPLMTFFFDHTKYNLVQY